MLKPYKIDLFVYAENAQEAQSLQDELKAFVNEKRQQGVAVTASALLSALRKFKNNQLLFNFLKYGK